MIKNDPRQIIPFEEYTTSREFANITAVMSKKKKSYIWLWLTLPYFFLNSCIVCVFYFLTGGFGRYVAAAFMSHFLSRYFRLMGVMKYYVAPPPVSATKPYIILGCRYHFNSALFAYKSLKQRTIVPYDTHAHPFRFKWFYPMRIINIFLKTFTYSDAPLKHNLNNIKQLLTRGYPVYVHANHGYSQFRVQPELYLHRAIKDLAELPVDIYLCRLNGLENYKFSSVFNPTLVAVDFKKLADILEGTTKDDPEFYRKISAYFGHKDFLVVS